MYLKYWGVTKKSWFWFQLISFDERSLSYMVFLALKFAWDGRYELEKFLISGWFWVFGRIFGLFDLITCLSKFLKCFIVVWVKTRLKMSFYVKKTISPIFLPPLWTKSWQKQASRRLLLLFFKNKLRQIAYHLLQY
jgi:hypothetical protein